MKKKLLVLTLSVSTMFAATVAEVNGKKIDEASRRVEIGIFSSRIIASNFYERTGLYLNCVFNIPMQSKSILTNIVFMVPFTKLVSSF